MRCVRVHEDGIRVDDMPRPVPGEGQILLEVAAVGVSMPAVRAAHRQAVQLPHAPGGEVSGRVAEIGPGVHGVSVGDRLAGVTFGAAYADAALLNVAFAHAVPSIVDDATAVALVRAGQVALGALRSGSFAAGERMLVTGAAGATGHLAVQAALALGASHVTGAVGSLAKADFLHELGAHAVVTYDEDDWGEPVDVVLDGVGGAAFAGGLRTLAPFGRLVTYNAVGGPIDVNELRVHSRSVIGFAMAHQASRRPETYRNRQHELWNLCADKRVVPRVHPMPLEDAAEAHRLIGAREHTGKLVLIP